MAHSPQTKAQAMAMLLTGDSPKYVAGQLGLPYATIKRWQGAAFDGLAAAIGPIDLGLFDFSPQNGHKKKRAKKRGNEKV